MPVGQGARASKASANLQTRMNADAVKQKLARRSSVEELTDRAILKGGVGAHPRVVAGREQLAKTMKEDTLNRSLATRATADQLRDRGIFKR